MGFHSLSFSQALTGATSGRQARLPLRIAPRLRRAANENDATV